MFSKKPPYVITIPKPCNENWHGMTLLEKGRFCNACSTVVKDFTGLSDAEIISELQGANGKLCGRFSDTQLNRELEGARFVLPNPRTNRLGRIAASFLLIHSFVNQVSAQQKSIPVAQHISNKQAGTNVKATPDTTNIVIKGKILDYHNNQPLKKLEVEIKGTRFKCVTDIYGRFKFQLPDSFAMRDVIITTAASAADFLDTTASFIPEVKVAIDSLPLRKSVNLWRYPMEAIPANITIMASGRVYKGLVVAQPRDLLIVEPLTALPSPSMPLKKESPIQKFRNLFKRKKNNL